MSQTAIIYNILQDGLPHRVDELADKVYGLQPDKGPCFPRIGARIYDIKKQYSVEITSFPDKDNPKLWCYQMVKNFEVEERHEKKEITLSQRIEAAKKIILPHIQPKEQQPDFGF